MEIGSTGKSSRARRLMKSAGAGSIGISTGRWRFPIDLCGGLAYLGQCPCEGSNSAVASSH